MKIILGIIAFAIACYLFPEFFGANSKENETSDFELVLIGLVAGFMFTVWARDK